MTEQVTELTLEEIRVAVREVHPTAFLHRFAGDKGAICAYNDNTEKLTPISGIFVITPNRNPRMIWADAYSKLTPRKDAPQQTEQAAEVGKVRRKHKRLYTAEDVSVTQHDEGIPHLHSSGDATCELKYAPEQAETAKRCDWCGRFDCNRAAKGVCYAPREEAPTKDAGSEEDPSAIHEAACLLYQTMERMKGLNPSRQEIELAGGVWKSQFAGDFGSFQNAALRTIADFILASRQASGPKAEQKDEVS